MKYSRRWAKHLRPLPVAADAAGEAGPARRATELACPTREMRSRRRRQYRLQRQLPAPLLHAMRKARKRNRRPARMVNAGAGAGSEPAAAPAAITLPQTQVMAG